MPSQTSLSDMSDQLPILDAETPDRELPTEPSHIIADLNTKVSQTCHVLWDASSLLEITEEFADLCVQMRTSPRPDVLIALRQMQRVVQVVPFSAVLNDPTFLTLRSLLEIAVDTQSLPARLRCFAFGVSYLKSVAPAPLPETKGAGNGRQKKSERFSEAQSELLAYFLLEPRYPRTNEQIAEALWPDKDFVRAQQAFHTARHRLHEFAGEAVILVMKRGHYLLNPNLPIWFDVAEFEKLYTRAQSVCNPSSRIKMLEGAVDLYRGDFLEKNYKDWTGPVRTRLRTKYVCALLQVGQLYEKEDTAQAIACYEKILRQDPLNEDAYFHLIALHAARGDYIAAQRAWLLCLETCKQELGTEPSPTFVERVQPYLAEMRALPSAD